MMCHATKCNVVRALYCSWCQNAMRTTVLKSVKDEPHQEHRLGTVSNNITRGLKPVLRDPNPRPRSWYGSYTVLDGVRCHLRQWFRTLFSFVLLFKPFQSLYTFSLVSQIVSLDFTLAGF